MIGRNSSNQDVPIALEAPLAAGTSVTSTELLPVIPNPTTGTSLVQYGLAARSRVDLSIYSVEGRRVRTLAHGVQEAGRYQLTWDGTDDRGAAMKSGVFFIRLDAAGIRKTRVLMVIR